MKKIEFYLHNLNNTDINNIVKVLKTPFLTTGTLVSEFEKNFSKYINAKETIGLTSCTAALHLSLISLGIGPGDEVITTPISFIATSNMIEFVGAKPVFVDVNPETGLIDENKIEEKITKKTKAILPVHLYGVMCNMKKIWKIAKKHKLKVIADSAHAIESKRNNYGLADYCDTVCFSFYATKNITCGEGGALSTNNKKLADKLRILRLHGMSKTAADRYTGKYEHYDMIDLGYKYNMTNIQAALLIDQLKRLDSIWNKKDKLYKYYKKKIREINNVKIPYIPENCKSAYHLFTISVKQSLRDKMIQKLQKNNIPVAVNFNPIPKMTYYKKKYKLTKKDLPNAFKFGLSTITLPFYPKLTKQQIDYITKHIFLEITKLK